MSAERNHARRVAGIGPSYTQHPDEFLNLVPKS